MVFFEDILYFFYFWFLEKVIKERVLLLGKKVRYIIYFNLKEFSFGKFFYSVRLR